MSKVTYTIDPERMKRLRQDVFLTQKELADKTGVSEQRIKQIEQGLATSIRPRTVRDLARGLGVGPDDLAVPIEVSA